MAPHKLHLGCGQVYLPGWVNMDSDRTLAQVDCYWDADQGLPFGDESCSHIHSEHFLEHLTVPQGLQLLAECHRVLIPDGILRIAMPSLEGAVQAYLSPNWRDQPWLKDYPFIQTKAEMLNICFRGWGHQWLYDREELYRRLHQVGFLEIWDAAWGQSDTPTLANLETRPESSLICEARKWLRDINVLLELEDLPTLEQRYLALKDQIRNLAHQWQGQRVRVLVCKGESALIPEVLMALWLEEELDPTETLAFLDLENLSPATLHLLNPYLTKPRI